MTRQMTNKQVLVLEALRAHGPAQCQEIADRISKETPCPNCDKPQGGWPSVHKCALCYGRGHLYFGYSQAYIALRQLMDRGFVARGSVLDEWGDETPRYMYEAVEVESDDPLEKLWLASNESG